MIDHHVLSHNIQHTNYIQCTFIRNSAYVLSNVTINVLSRMRIVLCLVPWPGT